MQDRKVVCLYLASLGLGELHSSSFLFLSTGRDRGFSYLRAPAGADAIQMTDWFISFHKKTRKASVFFQFRQEISILKEENPLPFITGIFGFRWLDWPFFPSCFVSYVEHGILQIIFLMVFWLPPKYPMLWSDQLVPVFVLFCWWYFPSEPCLCNLMFFNKLLRPLLNSWTFADIKLNTEVLTIYSWGECVGWHLILAHQTEEH